METQILRKAGELYFAYGCKSVSMDDLAKSAGISKKTIYQLVSDKNELVERVVGALLQKHQNALQQASAEARDAVQEVMFQMQHSYDLCARMHGCFLYDVEKFFPSVFAHLQDYRKQVFKSLIRQNMERGIREGYYRSDLALDFLAEVRLQHLMTSFYPDLFWNRKADPYKLMVQFTEFFLHGLANENGIHLIKKYINQNHTI